MQQLFIHIYLAFHNTYRLKQFYRKLHVYIAI